MYKLLIIDDEYLVRIGIEQTIDWKEYGVEIVGSAKHGKEGLSLAQKHHPDIIISDVRMPIMDGLDLVKAIKECNLDAVVIMLSGYKDFEYAKETLENGAFQYLLKPIDNQQLVDTVLKAIEEVKLRRKNRAKLESIDSEIPLITATVIQNLIAGNYSDIGEIVEKIRKYQIPVPEQGYVIYGQVDANENYDKALVKTANASLFSIIETNFRKITGNVSGIIFYSHFDFLVSGNQDEIIQALELSVREFETQHEEIISIGMSSKYLFYSTIYEQYLEAKESAMNKLLLTMNTITTEKNRPAGYKKLIADMIRYISKHYQENLTIQKMAKLFHVSESHLMHLFKDEVGKTFTECLSEYRIMIAKKLLLSGKYRIYEVSEMVGYDDSKYFSTVFKKTVGISPGDFSEKYRHSS